MAHRAAIQDFKAKIRGEVLLPSDSGYEEARRVYNGMVDRRPAMILRCAATADAVAGVQLAREKNVPLSIRGGGHNVSGNAVCVDGVMLDMSRMKGIQVDAQKRIATAEPGLTLGDYDQATTPQGLVTPLGIVSKTGIAGLTLGGGLGWLMGKHGLACDNLIGAEVVTADGKILHASSQENPDLLWGLRGGGGNFGVVTQFQYRLHKLEPTIAGMLVHSADDARALLRFFREITQDLPDELIVGAGLLNSPDGSPISALVASYSGDPAEGEKVLAPIRAFGRPLMDTVAPITHVQLQSMFDQSFPPGQRHYWKAGFLNALQDEVIDVMIEGFKNRRSPLAQVFLEHMHGAASRVPASDTAFAHRFNHYNLSAFGIWVDPEDDDLNRTWAQSVWKAAQPHLSGRAYVNYLGQEGVERVREAYGPNYDRLAALKKKYDPTNLFRYNQNVLPAS
jgi:FAD/FMN-containing dehydrogenase